MGTLNLCDFCQFRSKKTSEITWDQLQTCLIFPLRWTGFPIKIGRNAQWEHLFSMYFNDFLIIYLIFLVLKSIFDQFIHKYFPNLYNIYGLFFFQFLKSIFDEKMIFQWVHHILSIEACDAIRQGLNCCISMIIFVDTLCGFAPLREKATVRCEGFRWFLDGLKKMWIL